MLNLLKAQFVFHIDDYLYKLYYTLLIVVLLIAPY